MWETIWNLILPNIFEIILTIISLVVSFYVIPYVKKDLIPWLKEKHLYNIVKNLVQSVEKQAETGAIEKTEKKNKVVELLTSQGIKVDTTVETFIESCVKELDMATSAIFEEIKKGDIDEAEEN